MHKVLTKIGNKKTGGMPKMSTIKIFQVIMFANKKYPFTQGTSVYMSMEMYLANNCCLKILSSIYNLIA